MDDLIVEFITETNESLDELDVDLVNLEQNPNDKDLLGKIFRLMHTIKGTCGFLALPRLEKVAHHAENVLGRFRDGDLEVTPGYVTLIFESIDQIKYIVSEIEETGSEPEGSDKELIEKLDAAYEGKDVSGNASNVGDSAPAPADTPALADDSVNLPPIEEKELAPGEVSLEELEAAFASAPGMEGIVNPADEQSAEDAPTPPPPPPVKSKDESGQKKETKSPTSNQTLRVNVDVLEDLMTMVSELVLTRNQLLQIVRANGETEFTAPLQRLNHVVSELQEGVMKTRMQPIGNAWSKLPRIIRDLSIELDKKIELEMRGQDTELDRQVLEMIKDPLTHMVRNSGDHGIETPAERVAAGKPETGKIILNAFHEGGHILIQISDDGKGLAEDKIRDKIISNGLATEGELEEMSSQQIQQFIFKAGFSTAAKVTSVSGRGVGMDVVRTNIEKIGGSIELKSTEGKGSTFTIKIPLTLAIVSALIVEASGEKFAIPQLSVRELVMISENSDNHIEYIKGVPVFRLRDRLLPLVSLSTVLGLGDDSALSKEKAKEIQDIVADGADAQDADEPAALGTDGQALNHAAHKNLYIVIAQVGAYDFGIIVDKVFDTEEIVVKPVAQILKNMTLFSGNTILGDGSVIMILDPNGIASASGNLETDTQDSSSSMEEHKSDSEKKTSLLLFDVGDNTPKAVPLSLVARLENVLMSNVEYSSGQMMVQYRGSLMPLVSFNSSISLEGEKEKPVLVFADKGQSMGIIVNDIIDIIEERVDVQLSASQSGLLGSAIINGLATDVVDITHFLNSVGQNWFKDHGDEPFGEEPENAGITKKSLLLVDDSPFFRNMLTPVLGVAGYEVTTVDSPSEAIILLEKGLDFDIIISDIEMPDMDGFQFADYIKRSENRWKDTPMVALSSHATPADIERGLSVGFSGYVAKFDKDALISTLSQTLRN